VEEIVHPEDAAAHHVQRLAMASARQSHYDADRRLRAADGRWVWAQVSASTIQTANGETRLLAQLIDITDRKREEDDLRASVAELAAVEDVRAALREDRLVLYAQPICSLPDRTVVRHELLVRMIDREGRLVPPAQFLPAAERHGAIADLDRWVIARAIEVARAGQAVNVNISALSLAEPHLLDSVAHAVGRGLDPDHLAFEITETAMAADLSAAVAFAERAGALGCAVAIDDFGVGFGSLTYVQQLPNVCSLKIDRTFVAQLADRDADRQIVTAVVQLASSMRHTTVAEGIEDERALAAAAELGVGLGQGFLLGRPRPVYEIFDVALAS
jgi:EAL domain-containing protein (putative c-di-GMP-specific phosphodiesterase class I)